MNHTKVVRIIIAANDGMQHMAPMLAQVWLEQLRHAGLAYVHEDTDERQVFDLLQPHGVDNAAWSRHTAERMASFGFNAVVAPAWLNSGAPVQATIELSDKDLRDLLCTAFEQGSGYWARCDADDPVACALAPSGVDIIEHGGERDQATTTHRLTPERIVAAFALLPGHVLGNIVGGDYDALDADAFLQCATLGEVRYG
jgi:hypothetical protein